jgi:hypothetical protein
MSRGYEEDRKAGRIAIGIVLVLALAGGTWWWLQRPESTAVEPAEVAMHEIAEVVVRGEPEPIQHPLEVTPEPLPADENELPPVDPDVAAQDGLLEVFGGRIAEWLVTEQLARRLVATLDNLPRNTSVEKLRPLRPPATPFTVERETLDATVGEERITIAPTNHLRYDAAVSLLASTDAATAATVYRRIYPELQAAYEDLGYPGRYFNDRLVAVIDHLLATPESAGPLLLEQPKVLYRFADADLEGRSAGQKLLLRMGVEHARTVKQKLGEFRALIATPTPDNNKE